jgi:hypothetical protein
VLTVEQIIKGWKGQPLPEEPTPDEPPSAGPIILPP